ncbi:MAG: hypothetical protein WD492_01270 [Alkalispirochaeta sp.]
MNHTYMDPPTRGPVSHTVPAALAARTTRRAPALPAAFAILLAAMFLAAAGPLSAQTTTEMQEARQETLVVYDLGRFFGYVEAMVAEDTSPALTNEQAAEFLEIMTEIRETERIEPSWAEERLTYLELDVLTPAQLMEVDRRAIEWQNTRESTSEPGSGAGSGSGSGSSGGSGPLSTYVAGGAFNPILDETKPIGEGFAALYERLR